ALDAKRLANVFLFNRAIPPANLDRPRFATPRARLVRAALKTLYIAGYGISLFVERALFFTQKGDGAPKPALHGIYEVETFRRNGEEIPPLLTETSRWRWIAARRGMLVIRFVDGSVQQYEIGRDDERASLTVSAVGSPDTKYDIAYSRSDDGRLVFRTTLKNDVIVATVHKVDESKFTLVSRGFHWINETPFNR
ncbi:MAG TPA: hypothetical protein VNO21_22100, partial [Polyangiaceae bacterium]|nr:hypothetical protein [Polyangiaceae bacterium]